MVDASGTVQWRPLVSPPLARGGAGRLGAARQEPPRSQRRAAASWIRTGLAAPAASSSVSGTGGRGRAGAGAGVIEGLGSSDTGRCGGGGAARTGTGR